MTFEGYHQDHGHGDAHDAHLDRHIHLTLIKASTKQGDVGEMD